MSEAESPLVAFRIDISQLELLLWLRVNQMPVRCASAKDANCAKSFL